jgi:polysaccharide export outer membrane protein
MLHRLFVVCLALFWAVTAAAQQGYQIKAGDQISIEVLEDPSLNRQALVLPDGRFSFPLVGSVNAGGRTTDDVRQELSSALAPNFASPPSVFVSVLALGQRSSGSGTSGSGRTIDVYVIGEVGTPGMIEVRRGTTLLQMLSQTGGFTKFAATKRIQLRRVDPQTKTYVTYPFNYRAVESGAQISGSTVLSDGDVIVVPQRKLFE